jgi:hypothetical protein
MPQYKAAAEEDHTHITLLHITQPQSKDAVSREREGTLISVISNILVLCSIYSLIINYNLILIRINIFTNEKEIERNI